MSSKLNMQAHFSLAVHISLPDQINLKEEKKKKRVELIKIVAVSIPSVLREETNKQGQRTSKRLVTLCEQTAEGFIRGTTECSLKPETFDKTHTEGGCIQYNVDQLNVHNNTDAIK